MAGEDVDWAGLAHHLGQQPVGLGHLSVEREDVVGVEHELQPLPAVQLLDRVRARAHSVVQFAHADSADADLVGELGRASHRRVDDDGGVEQHPALGRPAHLVPGPSQGSAGRSSPKMSSASARSRRHCSASTGGSWARAALNSAAGTRRLPGNLQCE